MHRHGGSIVFWIFHSRPEVASIPQLSESAPNQPSYASAYCDDHAYLYEYSNHHAHPHPDGCTDIHTYTNPHKGPYVDIAARSGNSIHHSHTWHLPNRERHPSN